MTELSDEGKAIIERYTRAVHKYAYRGAIDEKARRDQVTATYQNARLALEHYCIKLENE